MKILRSVLRLVVMTVALLLVLLIADAAYSPLRSDPWESVVHPSEVPPSLASGR